MRSHIAMFTAFFACIFIITLVFMNTSVYASINASRAQVWGFEGSSAGYSGQDAYLTTPNPNISNGTWTGGPNGVTNNTDADSIPMALGRTNWGMGLKMLTQALCYWRGNNMSIM